MNKLIQTNRSPAVLRKLKPECEACKLYKTCNSPKMEISGHGEKGLMIVGEFPGFVEDEAGAPFVGPSGQILYELGRQAGLDIRRDCWLTNALSCYPGKGESPTEKQVGQCRPKVIEAIKRLKPKAILLTGHNACKSVIGGLWQKGLHGMDTWQGLVIPCAEINAWLIPTYNTAHLMYTALKDRNGKHHPVLEQMVLGAIKSFASKTDYPFEKVPDYESQVEIIYEDNKARDAINWFHQQGELVAFDYETDRLKPHHPDSRILCCSISDGKRTISYPWLPEARKATGELLASNVRKTAANIKFEQMWTMKDLGHGVNMFSGCSVLMPHILDPRHNFTSVKFQSFVRYGVMGYEDKVAPYMKAKTGNEPNRLDQLPLRDLLLYCGMDSLLEYKLITDMKKEIEEDVRRNTRDSAS